MNKTQKAPPFPILLPQTICALQSAPSEVRDNQATPFSADEITAVPAAIPEELKVAASLMANTSARLVAHFMSSRQARRSPADLAQDYPRLYELSINRGLDILSSYSKTDLMDLFGCAEKTIRRWTASGELPNRRLPNRGRCFPRDVELFLARTEQQALGGEDDDE